MDTITIKMTAILTAILMYLGMGSFLTSNLIENEPTKLDDDIRVMSVNLLSVANEDPQKSLTTRSKLFVDLINEYKPDSFGVQECNFEWLWILKRNIGDDYACVSQSRSTDAFDETNAVFYLKDKYKVTDSDTFWLSDTPDEVGSKFEKSIDPRICTWATLENKKTGETYTHVNTHLDFGYEYTKNAQLEVMLDQIDGEVDENVVLTGDFNAIETTSVYSTATKAFNDAKVTAAISDKGQTYHGMDDSEKNDAIVFDYVFVSQNTDVETYKIVDEKIGGLNYSDHYGICVDFNFM